MHKHVDEIQVFASQGAYKSDKGKWATIKK